jgi:DNA-binding IclR family transcriptional regulator
MKNKSYSTAKTVVKAFKILEILSEKQPLRASDLVRDLNLTRSNMHRLLSTMEDLGYIEKSDDSRFRLSFKIFMIGSTIPLKNNLIDIAHPYLIRLAEKSQENVNLAIMYEKKVLYIDKIESPHYLKLDQPIGKTDPLHCTALGKSLLSGFTDNELEVFLKSYFLVRFTKNTITNKEKLINVIQKVRKEGYATDLEELNEGIHCIGSPIYNYTNKVIGALSISGPKFRLTIEKMKELKVPLIETAKEISKKLGYSYLNHK